MISLFLIASSLCLTNPPPSVNLSSKKAVFDGKNLIFDEKITLSHPLGKIEALSASVENTKNISLNNPTPFSTIVLENNVKLTLNKGGILESEKASFDQKKQSIEFFKIKNQVTYLDKITQNETTIPLFVKADKAIAENPKKTTGFTFKNNVEINLENIRSAKGDNTFISPDKIFIYSENLSSPCFVHSKKFEINTSCSNLELNNKTLEILLNSPSGTIKKDILFSSKDLFISEPQKKLTMHDVTKLDFKSMEFKAGLLNFYFSENNIKEIEKITAEKNGEIIFQDEQNSVFSFEAPLFFDYKNNLIKTTAQDLKDILIYKNDKLTILSKQALFELKNNKKSTGIKKAILENEVYFLSNKISQNNTYAIADKLTYLPEKNIFILESLPGKKVLFSRNSDRLCLKAEKIEIQHNPKNKKEDKIKAFGNARFSLTPEEKKQLENKFTNTPQKL